MTVRGILFDLEGVLYQEGEIIPGALEAIRAVAEKGIAMRFLTNTTTLPRSKIVARMQDMGFNLQPEQVFTPALAACQMLLDEGHRRLHLAAPPGLKEDFAAFELVDENPDAVVMGDLHTDFTWPYLDDLFRMLLDDARLVALHKNRFCRRGEQLALDLGPFVAALEYASGTQALVVGKPSEPFFSSAVKSMDLQPGEVVMIGDDIETDIGGALAVGLTALQVKTGKYSPRDDAHPSIKASGHLSSVAGLPRWLDENS